MTSDAYINTLVKMVGLLIDIRKKMRALGDFETADKIRDLLLELGVPRAEDERANATRPDNQND